MCGPTPDHVAVTEFERIPAAFTEAAVFARDIMADPLVGAAWDEPSALARMTVGDVAGHLFLVVRRVEKHLDLPPPAGDTDDPITTLPYPRVDDPGDLDQDVHRVVRGDGRRVAAWGWSAVVAALDEKIERLGATLPTASDKLVIGGRTIAFPRYLATRVVEIVVHADDLATSVAITLPELPPTAAEVALEVALESARNAHGDLPVLLAFTRRERTPAGVPTIF
jgi:hypothetical protein